MDIESRRRNIEDIWFRISPVTSRPLSEFSTAVSELDRLFIVDGSIWLRDSEFLAPANAVHCHNAYLKSQLWSFAPGTEFLEVKISSTHNYILLKKTKHMQVKGVLRMTFVLFCLSLHKSPVHRCKLSMITGEREVVTVMDHPPMAGLVCCMCLQKTSVIHMIDNIQYCNLCLLPAVTFNSEVLEVARDLLPSGEETRFVRRTPDTWGYSMDCL